MFTGTATKFFIATAVAFVLIASQHAAAFFEFGDDLWGVETKQREVLPDGRIRYWVPEKIRQPIPEAVRAKIEKDFRLEHNPDTMYYSHSLDVTMQPHWKVFSVEKHSDASRMLCHEPGDINMRLSLFGISPELSQAIEQDFKAVILTASATKHQCHGQPIFRKITAIHKIPAAATSGGGVEELMLITAKARYDEIFDEADIHFELEHPHLTHVDSKVHNPTFDDDAVDHGVNFHASPASSGASRVMRSPQLMYPTEIAKGDPEQEDPQQQQQGNGVVASTSGGSGLLLPKEGTSVERSRNAAAQWGFFKKLKKKIKKKVKKAAKKARRAVRKVSRAVSKGVKSAVNKVKKALSININYAKSISYTWSTCDLSPSGQVKDDDSKNTDKKVDKNRDRNKRAALAKRIQLCSKNIGGLLFTTELTFTAGLAFKLRIKRNKLYLVMIKLFGGFGAGASVQTQTYNDGDGQSEIITIPGPRITFAIGPVPVWIDTEFPIVGGLSVEYGTRNKPLKAGFEVSATAVIGVQWSSWKGFQMLTSASFDREFTLDYPRSRPLIVSLAPYVGAQVRFSLYSLVTGYPQVLFGIDNSLTSGDWRCNMRGTGDFFIKLAAGIDIEIVILKLTVYSKSFGPWTLWSKTWRVYSWCTKKTRILTFQQERLALPQSGGDAVAALPQLAHQQQQQQEARTADALAVTTSVDDNDDGKVWTKEIVCNATHSFNFDLAGFFQNDSTLFTVIMTANITDTTDGNFTLVAQSFFGYMGAQTVLGLSSYMDVVPATQAKADELGVDLEDLQDLTEFKSGDDTIYKFNIEKVALTFSASNIDDITAFDVPGLCSLTLDTIGESNSVTTNSTNSAALVTLSSQQKAENLDFMEAFLITVSVCGSIAALIAVIELFLAWKCRGWIIDEEFWPKYDTEPRGREYIYAISAIVWGLMMFCLFIVAGNLQFASIIGARVDPNYVVPAEGSSDANSNHLTASGVEVVIYDFQGASVTRRQCPQYYPCSPNCRDLCVSETTSWQNTQWPWCSANINMTDSSGCSRFSGAGVAWTVVGILVLVVGIPVPLTQFQNVYRRAPIANAAFLLSGACLLALWYTIDRFMEETRLELFAPAISMVIPYSDVYFNEHSNYLFHVAVIGFFVGVVANFILMFWECTLFYKATVAGDIELTRGVLAKDQSVFVQDKGINDVDGTEMEGVGSSAANIVPNDSGFAPAPGGNPLKSVPETSVVVEDLGE